MTMLRVLGVLLLAAAAVVPASPAAAQDIVVGVAAPMTGNLAQIGKQFVEGAQLAADEVTFSFNDQREREAKDQVYLLVKDGKWTFIGRQTY